MEHAFFVFVLIGFGAQLIDGALGMAYGVVSSTFLLSFGIAPAAASASVHTAEVFTSIASGASHLFFGNVDRKLFVRLVIPGVVGAVTGAYVVSHLAGTGVKLFVAAYLCLTGGVILWKSIRNKVKKQGGTGRTALLGVVGGFLDAAGGGGWGPIVTSTLLVRGNHPRFTVGTVTLAEFFIAVVVSITFFITAGHSYWKIIAGLILGGMLAAPLAAYLCRVMPARILMILVGAVIITLSAKIIYDHYSAAEFPEDCYSFNLIEGESEPACRDITS